MLDDARRMYTEALGRLKDADILAQSFQTHSDSSALLRILGFEILLKCALVLCSQRPRKHHKYRELWRDLPSYAQEKILATARHRMPGHADLSQLDRLLDSYQVVFEKARYSYELYEGWTLEEQTEYGKLWTNLGAPENEADIQYYPNELTCLIDGLKAFIEERLSNL